MSSGSSPSSNVMPESGIGPRAAVGTVLQAIGADQSALLALEQLPTVSPDVVYMSGSLIEGFGNSRSDVDIFVIGHARPSNLGIVIEKEQFSISVHFFGNRRVDFEYWRPEHVRTIAEHLRAIPVGESFVADKMDPADKLFVHRLRTAQPLCNEAGLAALQTQFDFAHFQRYLVQEAIHRIDGALEDIWGMMETSRLLDAALRARDLAGIAADAQRFAGGETNPLQKWRAASLSRLAAGDERYATFLKAYLAFEFPDPPPQFACHSSVLAYVKGCADLAEEVVRSIQG